MALPELTLNSPTPGTKAPITTLAVAVTTTPAALTVETWTLGGQNVVNVGSPFVAALPTGLTQPGQFRFQIDSEICLDITGSNAANRTVMRGVEGSTVATHAIGASVYHYMTAAALQNLVTQNQPALGTFQAHAASAVALTSGWRKIALDTKDFDSSGWFSTAVKNGFAGYFQPTVAGYYQFNASLAATGTAATGGFVAVGIAKNNTQPVNVQFTPGVAADWPAIAVSSLIYLNGTTDYVELWGIESTQTQTFTGYLQGFMAAGIGSASTAQGLSTVARAYRNAAYNLTTSLAKIQLDTVATGNDPGSNFNVAGADGTATKGRYTCSATGYYHVSYGAYATGTASAQTMVTSVYLNGVTRVSSSNQAQSGGSGAMAATGSDIIYCQAGDYMELWGITTPALAGVPGVYTTFLSVVQVGGTSLLGALSPTAQTANFTASAGQLVLMTGANTVTLPSAPMTGSQVAVNALTATVTLVRGGTDQINASGVVGSSLVIPAGLTMVFTYSAGVWYAVSGVPPSVPYGGSLGPTNGSFETDTSGWAATGFGAMNTGATLTRVTTQSVIGAASMQVVTTAASILQGAAASVTGTFRAGVPYLISMYLKGNAGGEVVGIGGADNSLGDQLGTPAFALTASWRKYSFVYVPPVDLANFYVFCLDATTTVNTWFMDAVQVVLL